MSNNYVKEVIDNIRGFLSNEEEKDYSTYEEQFKKKTYTQKQWEYKMKATQMKENLRKKSTRLQKYEQEMTNLDNLEKMLEEEEELMYKRSWKKLLKNQKINRLIEYYEQPYEKILQIYTKIKDKDVNYDESEGKIKNIDVKNIFENV